MIDWFDFVPSKPKNASIVQSESVYSEVNTKCVSRHNIPSPEQLDDNLQMVR